MFLDVYAASVKHNELYLNSVLAKEEIYLIKIEG